MQGQDYYTNKGKQECIIEERERIFMELDKLKTEVSTFTAVLWWQIEDLLGGENGSNR